MGIDWNTVYSWVFVAAVLLVAAYLVSQEVKRTIKRIEQDKFVPNFERCKVRLQRKWGDGFLVFTAVISLRNAKGKEVFLTLEDQVGATSSITLSCLLPTVSRNILKAAILTTGYGREWRYEDFGRIASELESMLGKVVFPEA